VNHQDSSLTRRFFSKLLELIWGKWEQKYFSEKQK
jgi:hypothetical protein